MNKIPENSLQIGTVLNDKWVILEFVGKGGMGEVYRAHQLNLKRDVAIKIISREWLESLDDDEEELLSGLQRFRNEMQAMAQVRHPNILSIFDQGSFSVQGSKGEVPLEYIAMEYLPGGTLRSTMSDEGIYPEEGLVREWLRDYFLPVLDGLEALHDAGIVHRDIKPENILLDGKTPKIADFGLARSKVVRPLTQSADMKGTPGYMSPEQFLDFRRTDERADVYALGKILYEAVDGKMKSGTIPFKKAALKSTGAPFFQKLDSIIQKATEEEKGNRFPSVKALRTELLQALESPLAEASEKQRRGRAELASKKGAFSGGRKWAWVGAAMALMLIAAAVFLFRVGPNNRERPLLPQQNRVLEGSKKGILKTNGPTATPKTIHGEDGANLCLIPGETIALPGKTGASAVSAVKSFYLEETPVTNHQFVDFLNRVLPSIRVEEGVVKGQGNIWLYLGEVLEGYEPIMYRDGRFHINKPAHAACPVIRVTAYGASAYARFFHRRLPTAKEWAFAVSKGRKEKSSTVTNGKNETGETMDQVMSEKHGAPTGTTQHRADVRSARILLPVIDLNPNALGIRGLNGDISEWGLRTLGMRGTSREFEYVVLGRLGKNGGKDLRPPGPIPRKPWEAFEEVGFRTALSIPGQN